MTERFLQFTAFLISESGESKEEYTTEFSKVSDKIESIYFKKNEF